MRPMTLLVEGLMTSRVAPATAPTRSPATRAGVRVASAGGIASELLMASWPGVSGPLSAAEGGVAVGADADVHQHALAGAGGGDRGRQRCGQLRAVADL